MENEKSIVESDGEGQQIIVPKLSQGVRRIVIISLFLVLVWLAMWMAYAYGGIKACDSVNGILSDQFICQIEEHKEMIVQNSITNFTWTIQ